ncbi:PleD family two-component system response regulator [Thermodesulfobacteriota bacterium]
MAAKILVIEDDQDTMLFLRTVLEKNNYQVMEASDGLQGQEKLRSRAPDLVCLDLALPKKSGTELYCEMQADAQLSQVPVVIVSVFMSRQDGHDYFQRLVYH